MVLTEVAPRASDKRDLILEAAIRAFARRGYHQATMADIAREAGIAAGTIYLYFKSKDDLLNTIFAEKVQQFVDQLRQKLQAATDARAKLHTLVFHHLAAMQHHPSLAAVFQIELRQSRRFMSSYPKAGLKGYYDLIGEVIEEGQQQGIFRHDLYLALVKRALFGAIDETVTSWLVADKAYDLTGMAAPLVELFLRGLAQGNHPSED